MTGAEEEEDGFVLSARSEVALEEEEVRIICVYGPQSGRTGAEKKRFYDDLSEWDLHSKDEL